MSESDMRTNLVDKLKKLDACSVENPAGPETPDVQYIGGFIELKWLRAWPKRPGTPVTLDHPLLASQKVWIKRRIRRGGAVWVLLQCGREWLLFRGDVAVEHLGTSTKAELYDLAHAAWYEGLDTNELILTLEEWKECRKSTL